MTWKINRPPVVKRMPGSNHPPAGAVLLADALEQYVDPRLVEALHRLEAGGAGKPGPYAHLPDGDPGPAKERARRAVHDDFFRRWRQGKLAVWGRDEAPGGAWRRLDAAPDLRIQPDQDVVKEAPGAAPRRQILVHDRQKQLTEEPGMPSRRFVVVRVALTDRTAAPQEAAPDRVGIGDSRRDAAGDARRRTRILAVLATAKQLWPDNRRRPSTTTMALKLVRQGKAQGYAGKTLRMILDGKYEPAKKLGIGLDW